VGRTILANLIRGSYHGRVFAVNPRRSEILGTKCYPTVARLPEAIDLAVIATPALTVLGVVRDCVDPGVKSAVVISAGFKERGAAGVELERQIHAELRRGANATRRPELFGHDEPGTGPERQVRARNCPAGKCSVFEPERSLAHRHSRLKSGRTGWIQRDCFRGVDIGRELISFFGEDPKTQSILLYMESLGDARSFLSAAREVALSKPIIVIKPGRTEGAAKAASSHTGALAGSDDVFDAALQRCGVLRVQTISELFDMASVLSKQPKPRGPLDEWLWRNHRRSRMRDRGNYRTLSHGYLSIVFLNYLHGREYKFYLSSGGCDQSVVVGSRQALPFQP
jgi:acetyltransferase